MTPKHRPLPAPERPQDPTPLELAIYNYEVACAKYHNGKTAMLSQQASKEERQKLYAAQEKDWQHLQRRKAALATHAQLQGELETYRTENRLKDPFELQDEPHHPTQRLTRHLYAIGEVKPSPKHAAHHIIMGKGRYRAGQMARARLNLHLFGVGINDPINGVWLANNRKGSEQWRVTESSTEKPRHWATPESPVHLSMHGANYETWITVNLGQPNMQERSFMVRLQDIKRQLRFGGYPKMIEEPQDPNWKGDQ
ncbi:AHH domain-containing protein [Gallaecimonas kandeliae]|uniref:AHH domain-containing protein n=1 Tax=Gallaecimonas kandeliae TaxID=3029055 RepID=UPI00264887BF|nr:AHH domain-containing protein [Gallaecimonas kandeliae]WKE66485.1 AHH domain-containing protein [Gallaecimonas kandeliae]